MLVILVILSFLACSVAQPTCETANQTLLMDSDCLSDLEVVLDGATLNDSTNATVVMMACEDNTMCNQNIRSYLDNCPVSIFNRVIWPLSLYYLWKNLNRGLKLKVKPYNFIVCCTSHEGVMRHIM